jgi:hypothetical protein
MGFALSHNAPAVTLPATHAGILEPHAPHVRHSTHVYYCMHAVTKGAVICMGLLVLAGVGRGG